MVKIGCFIYTKTQIMHIGDSLEEHKSVYTNHGEHNASLAKYLRENKFVLIGDKLYPKQTGSFNSHVNDINFTTIDYEVEKLFFREISHFTGGVKGSAIDIQKFVRSFQINWDDMFIVEGEEFQRPEIVYQNSLPVLIREIRKRTNINEIAKQIKYGIFSITTNDCISDFFAKHIISMQNPESVAIIEGKTEADVLEDIVCEREYDQKKYELFQEHCKRKISYKNVEGYNTLPFENVYMAMQLYAVVCSLLSSLPIFETDALNDPKLYLHKTKEILEQKSKKNLQNTLESMFGQCVDKLMVKKQKEGYTSEEKQSREYAKSLLGTTSNYFNSDNIQNRSGVLLLRRAIFTDACDKLNQRGIEMPFNMKTRETVNGPERKSTYLFGAGIYDDKTIQSYFRCKLNKKFKEQPDFTDSELILGALK